MDARERGNDKFRSGSFLEAARLYTLALASENPDRLTTCAILSNRAAALLQLGRWGEARDDARRVLGVDPAHRKAKNRRRRAV